MSNQKTACAIGKELKKKNDDIAHLPKEHIGVKKKESASTEVTEHLILRHKEQKRRREDQSNLLKKRTQPPIGNPSPHRNHQSVLEEAVLGKVSEARSTGMKEDTICQFSRKQYSIKLGPPRKQFSDFSDFDRPSFTVSRTGITDPPVELP
ncbi:hypothetical protein F2Q69_00058150 [Brassica cretica]|uniref:Uncharacterized protein n=1 Tax=Brassica cretica TaxID=69181 RepID=A0A8S9RNU4_BRACR|nr:hypothetical protein F2Q69_00058150 [Brassica cretica]